MVRIYIARHGQDGDNAAGILNGHRDMPLTALGRAQAEELAVGVRESGIVFDAVYASPLMRAHHTARAVTTALGLRKPVIMPELIERDFGIMTGKRVADVRALCAPDIVQAETITYFLSPPGAETFPQLLARGTGVLERIKRRHQRGAVLLVTHGDIGKMIYAAYYGLPWLDILTLFHFGNSELLLLSRDSRPEDAHVMRMPQHNH